MTRWLELTFFVGTPVIVSLAFGLIATGAIESMPTSGRIVAGVACVAAAVTGFAMIRRVL